MIEYINRRMVEWATWNKRREDGGLGYPSKSNYCNLVHVTSASGAGRVTETAAALEIESIVVKMRGNAPHQYNVAYWFYLAGSLTMKRVAQELNCTERTAYNRLHALHLAVMEALHDIDIEAQDRAAAARLTVVPKEAKTA